MATTKTKKIITILAILNATVLAFYFYLFSSIDRMDTTTSEKVTEIESGLEKERQLRSIKNLMIDTKSELGEVANFFIQPTSSVDFIEQVESLGEIAQVNTEIESVGIDSVKNKTSSSTESFKISLKTKGLWTNSIHLLILLESMPYHVSFDSINLQKVSEGAESAANKGKDPVYWVGNFVFSVLKIKTPPQISKN
ncbi:MAG: hypothetical protein AAB688_01365 [Patescibacteria group bacterium]